MKDAAMIFAFITVESDWNPRAFLNDRNGGSYGLMQIDYQTACDRGYKGTPEGLYDPPTNIKYGCAILDWIADDLKKHDLYSIDNLAAAFNSGLEHVISGGTDESYSAKIKTQYALWRAVLGED